MYKKIGTSETFHYIHTDYLGSWLAITDGNGSLTHNHSYDAWGRPRDPFTWELMPIDIRDAMLSLTAMQPHFDRGYTGHSLSRCSAANREAYGGLWLNKHEW